MRDSTRRELKKNYEVTDIIRQQTYDGYIKYVYPDESQQTAENPEESRPSSRRRAEIRFRQSLLKYDCENRIDICCKKNSDAP